MSPTPRRPGQLTPKRRTIAYGVCWLRFCSTILASSDAGVDVELSEDVPQVVVDGVG